MSLNLSKYRKYSKHLMFVSIGMIVLLTVSFIVYNYYKTLSTSEDAELEKLSAIAKTLALQIDGDRHEQLVCQYLTNNDVYSIKESDYYNSTCSILKKAQLANGLETPIYTLFKKGLCDNNTMAKQPLLFGVSSGDFIYSNFWGSVPEDHYTYYSKGHHVHQYLTENGNWLSAFYPIKNSSDETIAILQIDRSFSKFISSARQDAIYQSIFGTILLTILGGLFIYYYRRILIFMNSINKSLNKIIKEKTEALELSNTNLSTLNEELEEKVRIKTQDIVVANTRLQESNKKLETFAYSVSHDLKAPIRNVHTFSKLLEAKYEPLLDEQGKEFIHFIVSSSENLTTLITDILAKALFDSNRQKKILPIDLNKVLAEVTGNLKNDIEVKNAEINYANLPIINGYKSDFVQLFQNLISNSLKYSKSNIDTKIKVTSNKEDGFHLITIEDNGKGISETALQNIFNEWDRGDENDNKGHGIGLATCKNIIKEYNGTMSVSSKLNKGSVFNIKIKDLGRVLEHSSN